VRAGPLFLDVGGGHDLAGGDAALDFGRQTTTPILSKHLQCAWYAASLTQMGAFCTTTARSRDLK
jgi:hypothetical protein